MVFFIMQLGGLSIEYAGLFAQPFNPDNKLLTTSVASLDFNL